MAEEEFIEFDEVFPEQAETKLLTPPTETPELTRKKPRPPTPSDSDIVEFDDVSSVGPSIDNSRNRTAQSIFTGFLNLNVEAERRKGEIGGFENLKRKQSSLLGDFATILTFGATESKGVPEFLKSPTLRLIKTKWAIDRIQADDYEDRGEPGDAALQREEDQNLILDYMVQLEEERIRGVSIPGEIVAGYLELPEFMIAFIYSGGLSALSKQAVKRGLAGFVRGSVKTSGKRSLIEGLARGSKKGIRGFTELSAQAVARTVQVPQIVGKNYIDRRVGANFEVTNKGTTLLGAPKEDMGTSLMKAVGDTLIEMGSEESGRFLSKIIPKGMRKNLEKLFLAWNPKGNVDNLWTKVGFNGFITELGEEQVGDYLRALTGVEDFGTDENATTLDKLIASQHGWRELLINSAVIAPIATAHAVSTKIADKKRAQAKEWTQQEANAVRDKELARREKAKLVEARPSDKPKIVEGVQAVPKVAPTPVTKKAEPKVEEKPKKAKATKEQKLFVEGRVDELNRESNTLNDQLKTAEGQRSELIKLGRSVNQINQKIQNLTNKIVEKESEIEEIQAAPATIEIKPSAKIRTTPSRVLSTIKFREKESVRDARGEAKRVQTQLVNEINRFGLPEKDALKLTKRVKTIQTQAQLEKELPKLITTAKNMETKAAKKRINTTIAKRLKGVVPKKRGGKPLGKLTPEIQKKLDLIKEATVLDAEVAGNRIRALEEQLKEVDFGSKEWADLTLKKGVLDLASNAKDRNVDELEGLLSHVNSLIKDGRSALEAKIQRERARIEGIRKDVTDILPPLDSTASQKKGFFKSTQQKLFNLGRKGFYGWNDFMDILSFRDTKSKSFESKLSRHMDVTEAQQEEKRFIKKFTDKLYTEGKRIYDLKSNRQLLRELDSSSRKIDLGIHKDASGENKRIELTRAEMRKIFMEMLDPTIKENVMVKEGGYKLGDISINGITEGILLEIDTNLSSKDKAFARAQMSLYKEIYQFTNAQFRKDNNVDLPFNEFYSSISRELGQRKVTNIFLDEMGYRKSVSPGALKTRVQNFNKLKVQSDINAIQSHISNISSYLAWSDKLKDINAVFGNSDIRSTIQSNFGFGMMNSIDGHIQRMTDEANRRHVNLNGFLNKVRTNFQVAALALKPSLMVKQMASTAAFAETIPVKDFTTGMVDFLKNPVKNWQTLNRLSSLFATRMDHVDRDMADLSRSVEAAAFKKVQSFKNRMLIFTKLGDKGAIALGGWAVYRHHLKRTGSETEAIKEFDKVVSATQQSGDISQQSLWQSAGPLAKLFTMFTSAQNQYLRREMGAIRAVLGDPVAFVKGKGRIGRREFSKKIAIYHFVLPMLFQWMSDFGQWDEDEQKRAAILGPFNGLFIIGDILDEVIKKGLNEFDDANLKLFGRRSGISPVFDIINGFYDFLNEIDFDEIGSEDFDDAIKDLLEDVAGPAAGVPVKRFNDFSEGLNDIMIEDETVEGVLKLMGWSPFIIEKQLGKKKSKGRFDF